MSFRFRRRRRRDDSHLDDWLMTYADMITLLLCFFAIFLSVSTPRKDKFEQAREKVIEQFAPPDVVTGLFPPRERPGSERPRPDESEEKDAALTALSSIIDDYSRAGVNIVKGDRFVTIEMDSAPFFASGSAALNPEGLSLLKDVAKDLGADEFRDFMISVEGHTDDVPIKTAQYPSNWELSTGRATSVVRFFLEQGIVAQRLRASGYADAFPKVPNRDSAGKSIPENQAKNRRVVVRLERINHDEEE